MSHLTTYILASNVVISRWLHAVKQSKVDIPTNFHDMVNWLHKSAVIVQSSYWRQQKFWINSQNSKDKVAKDHQSQKNVEWKYFCLVASWPSKFGSNLGLNSDLFLNKLFFQRKLFSEHCCSFTSLCIITRTFLVEFVD